MNPERRYFLITVALCGATAIAMLGSIARMGEVGATGEQSAGAATAEPTSTYGTGELVDPQPEGVTIPTEPSPQGVPLLEVVSTSGEVYKVQKMDTGQYKIIEPEPQLFDIKFLRPEDVSEIR